MADETTLPDNALLDGPDARPLYVGRSSASDSPPTPPSEAKVGKGNGLDELHRHALVLGAAEHEVENLLPPRLETHFEADALRPKHPGHVDGPSPGSQGCFEDSHLGAWPD